MDPQIELRITELRRRLTLGAVAVVGAGMSVAARFPMTSGLTSMLWDALDHDPETRSRLSSALKLPDTNAKSLVGDDYVRQLQAWEFIGTSPRALTRFQSQFAALDSHRSAHPSKAHEALAELVHAGIVECVISLNWDTALESTYQRLYGTALPKEILFKPHGDAADCRHPWTLPHEDGSVTPALRTRIAELVDDHARTLLVIGYSESDQVIVDELIAPLDQGWRVSRIGPQVTGRDDIAATADDAMPRLADGIGNREANSSWSIVSFTGRRDIAAALAGERLGPSDVLACPRLREVDLVADSLRHGHAVVLNGDSGSGKSITAYQALHDLAAEGFEVLRLRDDARQDGLRRWIGDLAAFPHKKALLIDDAQDMSPETIRELAETATPEQIVLVVGIDHVAGGVVTLHLSNTAAVGQLAMEMRLRSEEILPIVHRLDDRVGNQSGDDRLEWRIQESERAEFAWQFFHTLTGGWRRTQRLALELRGHNRADLTLLALAVGQISKVDAGVTVDELTVFAEVLGQDSAAVLRNLSVLRARHSIIESDGILRCVHQRSAWALIQWMLHPPSWPTTSEATIDVPAISSASGPGARSVPSTPSRPVRTPVRLPGSENEADRAACAALLKLALDSPETPLRGAAWLTGSSFLGEVRWVLKSEGVLTPERFSSLAERALSIEAGPALDSAAQLLYTVMTYTDGHLVNLVRTHGARLREWMQAVTPENGWALGNLANVLINDDREFAEGLLGDLNPANLAALITRGSWPHMHSTTTAVDRIVMAGGKQLREAVAQVYDWSAFDQLADSAPKDLHEVSDLLYTLAATNMDLGLHLFERLTPHIASVVSADPPANSQGLFRTWSYLLGFAPSFLRGKRTPTAKARQLAKKFVRSLDSNALAHALSRPKADWTWSNFHEFIFFVWEVDEAFMGAVIDRMDVEVLARSLEQGLPRPTRNYLLTIYMLNDRRPTDAVRLLERYEDQFEELDVFLALTAPDMAIRLLKTGLPLDLKLQHQDWDSAAPALHLIADRAPGIAAELAISNSEGFKAGLRAHPGSSFTGLTAWVAECDAVDPRIVDDVLTELPEGVVNSWVPMLRTPQQKRETAPLVLRAAQLSGTASQEALLLLRRFPSLRRNFRSRLTSKREEEEESAMGPPYI